MSQLQHHYLDLDDIRLHYVDAGDGPLVLFIHGFPEFWYAWQEQLEAFSRDHRAVALDLRGHNLSGKPTEVKAYRPKHLVADLTRLIDHLGGRPALVVAHDWGGAAAWNLAAAHPEYIEKLVIINSPHPVTFARELRDSPAQQQASDEYECHRWAVAQTGFDPTGVATGQGTTAPATARNDYQRARTACLEGRGYTVR